MKRYRNLGGDSGIVAYEDGADFIRVQFSDGSIYLYNYTTPGANDVEHMKQLAETGQGLNSFISRVVMNELQYPGARWWKFDFHTHTPKSMDFNDKKMTPESWLKAFMEKKIDCVAITDHNSGGWIDILQEELKKIEDREPHWYHPLYLFPGVEISAHGNVHVLAIFGCNKNKSDIDNLLDAVNYQGTKGDSNGVTTKSLTEVVDEIAERGGIPLPAHTDKTRGLFKELEGLTLQQILENENIDAMELCDSNYQKPQLYTDEKVQWTEIKGSDTHSCNDPTFGTFTWIKMDKPSIEGLKLALRDGDASVNRIMNENPNDLPEYFIKSLEVSKAKYIGRPEPLNCRFSPFLNTIIGGRGSGKSTLLEFMRLALQRDTDLHKALKMESRKYFDVDMEEDGSLLIEDSKISLTYCKGKVQYRLNWSHNPDYPLLEEEKDGIWSSCAGEIKSLFPVRIYSQKEIFELAKEPSALIEIIDEAPAVEAARLKTQNKNLVNRYKQIEGRQRELNNKISQENKLRGELNDQARQIEQIEKSGHKEVLQNYRERQKQLNELDSLESKWKEMCDQLLETLEKITPSDFYQELFSENKDILSDLKRTNDKWSSIHSKLKKLRKEAKSIITEWQAEKDVAPWMQDLESDIDRYEQSRSDLEQQGIDPDKYHLLLTQQKSIQKELDLIDEYQSLQRTLESEKKEVFDQIRANRKALSKKRQEFLTSVLHDNQFVSIEVLPFGEEWDEIENKIRYILQCPDRFDRDFEGLKKIYEQGNGDKIKETINAIRNGDREAEHRSFTTRLQALSPESIIDLNLWFPEDNLKITFGPNQQPIKRGSPGEKAAALLAFILSYGDEPLLLDQPEDDLDNELIYDLIVRQLRETKTKRQVIVVTHNANIVVNGDAEMVLPLVVRNGQTYVQQPASIQEKEVREAICNILEGGEKAFEQRYKRIHLGD